VTLSGLSGLAAEAIAAFPILAKAQLVRSWGALRILSPDGLPIYQQSLCRCVLLKSGSTTSYQSTFFELQEFQWVFGKSPLLFFENEPPLEALHY
jgi:hypothetical protein